LQIGGKAQPRRNREGGFMFLGMMFVAAAAMGPHPGPFCHPGGLLGSASFAFARAFTYNIMHIYALKMAAVFMIPTSTLAINTHLTARWIAFLGFTFAMALSRYDGRRDALLREANAIGTAALRARLLPTPCGASIATRGSHTSMSSEP